MNKLQGYRESYNYSFDKMAKKLGISKTFYWQIEKGKRRLSYDMAIRIAEIFDLKPDDLFYEKVIKDLKDNSVKKTH